ncbi:alpha/beta hydrolase [Teichococcus oryzae]|uniref:Alpha/beta hydrolase n=1 Tax=Teichococcus oryzae TaxID=1608942 RepID=A0A5B2TL56_9PROT|nr:alpha/beta hydrolase [Pseudoroseomonas oryzae]KAA2214658.1 alpha/beta hydrolase [Pseudoroseomonas oryzae]
MAAVHPDIRALMQKVREAGNPPFEALGPVAARKVHAERALALQSERDSLPVVQDLAADGVRVRLYRATPPEAGTAQPCLLFLHGGGWVLGSLETHDWVCRRLARLSGACVLAVDYRLAPEHPYPAAVEDCLTALRWLVAQAERLGIDATRIAVGGDSAGANLAAVLALMGRDGTAPASTCQLLFYPTVDLAITEESYARTTENMLLGASTMRWFIEQYVPRPEQRTEWQASPLRAASLAGLPVSFVLTAGHDPLRDEGRRYAARLEAEGVAVTALHLSGMTHGFLTMDRAAGPAAGVLDMAAKLLRETW